MGTRLELHNILLGITNNVYFQPPPSLRMQYPCIVYERSGGDTKFADNNPYTFTKRYKITAITNDPDNDLVDKLARLPRCVYDRPYIVDNLNHDVFNLYF